MGPAVPLLGCVVPGSSCEYTGNYELCKKGEKGGSKMATQYDRNQGQRTIHKFSYNTLCYSSMYVAYMLQMHVYKWQVLDNLPCVIVYISHDAHVHSSTHLEYTTHTGIIHRINPKLYRNPGLTTDCS